MSLGDQALYHTKGFIYLDEQALHHIYHIAVKSYTESFIFYNKEYC